MQKVVGSNPISRFPRRPRCAGPSSFSPYGSGNGCTGSPCVVSRMPSS
jgi:hypothetical protein